MTGNNSLELYHKNELLFSSSSSWLHPLFELEDFLTSTSISPKELKLIDKVTGRAAALLFCRMGIPQLHSEILSQRAVPILEKERIQYTFTTLVDRIDCKTEEILAETTDKAAAYGILAARAGRSE